MSVRSVVAVSKPICCRLTPDAARRLKPRGLPADFPAPNHPGPRYSSTPAVPGLTASDVQRLVGEARKRGVSGIWVVSRFPGLFDPSGALPAALGGGDGGAEAEFAPIGIRHYRLAPPGRPTPFNTDTGPIG